MERHTPSVVAYVVWHPSFERGASLARQLFTFLNRDLEDPEARAIGIPVYFRSAPLSGGALPPDITPAPDTLSFVILLVDRRMGEDPRWRTYIESLLARLPTGHVLACVFTRVTPELGPAFGRLNSVRLLPDSVPEAEQPQRMLHEVSHALSRLLLHPPQLPLGQLPPPAISLFVSHAKRDGLRFAEALRGYILSHTQGGVFFDTTHIAPGFPFDVQIFTGIARSALIVIKTDAYASREWCLREVIEAKRHARPIVVLDAVQKGEERSFPYLGNVPTLRWMPPPEDPQDPVKSRERLEQSTQEACRALVDLTVREVLRAAFFTREIEHLKALYPFLAQAKVLPRPPELLTALHPERGAPAPPVIYPDPPIGDEELEVIAPYHGAALTPVLLPGFLHGLKPQEPLLDKWTLGISIGNPEPEELTALGLSEENVREVTIECARYLLAHGARLAYGGNLSPGGFTEQLITLVHRHNRAGGTPYRRLENHLAWHLHQGLSEDSEDRAMSVQTVRVSLPEDLRSSGGEPRPPFDAYTRTRCMTAMREHMNSAVHARVVLGGKLVNYSGRWPGIIEEAYLLLKAGKPLFLLGGFGGAAGWLARVVRQEMQEVPVLPQARQQDLADLGGEYARHGRQGLEGTDLTEALAFFRQVSPSDFRNGLEPAENDILLRTTSLSEILSLLIKGFARLASGSGEPVAGRKSSR
ncbi:TIR domain-containing protein [Hyalangium sp.]|uniref:TIR domain-containing protein n=1 Tax=Hyalangium sp. TaxID=2028555 RepID=UPI002D6D576D|nr:TIR domain-containing protein [Hyalangium sp.]HYH98958.1 TIR domain-containing protein [Hyalangium sp.]